MATQKKQIKKAITKKPVRAAKKVNLKKSNFLKTKAKVPVVFALIAIMAFAGIGGYLLQNNSFAASDVPAPSKISNATLDRVMWYNMTYGGKGMIRMHTMPAKYKPYIKKAIEALGGNKFLAKWNKKATPMLEVSYNVTSGNYAETYTDKGNVRYDRYRWDTEPKRIVPTLIHELTHAVGGDLAIHDKTITSLYLRNEFNNSKRWDEYAYTSMYEYQACAFEWIILNERDSISGEKKRSRLKRMDPELYQYMTKIFIPWMYRKS